MKRLVKLALSAMLIFAMPATSVLAEGASVKLDGLVTPLSVEPQFVDDYITVGMNEIFTLLGAKVVWNPHIKEVTATKDKTTIRLKVDSNTAHIDNKPIELAVAPYILDDKMMIPLRFVSEAFGARVQWREKSRTVEITTNKPNVFNANISVLDKRKSINNNTTQLTYSQALDTALKANSQLEALKESMEYMRELDSKLGTSYGAIDESLNALKNQQTNLTSPYSTYLHSGGEVTPEIQAELIKIEAETRKAEAERAAKETELENQLIQTLRQQQSTKNQIENEKLNKQIIADGSEFMLKTYLSNISSYTMDIQMLEEKIKLSKTNLNNVTLKNSVGMASDSEVKSAELTLKQDETSLASLKILLANEKQGLNNLLKFPANRDVFVNYEPTIKAVRLEYGLDSYVRTKINADPTIKMKQQAVDEAKYVITTGKDNEAKSKLQKENDLSDAERKLENAKSSMDKSLRSTYNTIKQLEERQKTLELDLTKAKNDYYKALSSLEAGMVTQFEVDAAKLLILDKEIAIVKNAYNYNNLVFSFEKPYLLATGS